MQFLEGQRSLASAYSPTEINMPLTKILMPLMASICLIALPAIARADDGPPPGGPEIMEHCKDNPEKCKAMKERMEKRCAENPERCAEMKKHMQEMRETCKKDPAACKQKREEMREMRHQHMKEMCEKNPEKCKEWKEHHKQGKHEHDDGPHDHSEAPGEKLKDRGH